MNINIIIGICLCFITVDGYFLGNVTRFKRDAKCGDGFNKCGSGECINEDLLCDGKEDCKDGTDESNSCANLPCQSFLFRCAYGACINSDFVCDGKKDCKDNSDETAKKCKRNNDAIKFCSTDQFQCNSGQCIDDFDQCDGVANCDDGSDETVDACGTIPCQKFTFKCSYGACINQNLRCNGKIDCVDGSDENGCGGSVTVVPPTKVPPTKQTTVRPPIVIANGCILPKYLQNGKWTVFGNNNLLPGDAVNPTTIVQFDCNTEYKIFPPSQSNHFFAICISGKFETIPQCIKTCPSVQVSNGTKVTCDLNGSLVDCTQRPYHGTRAKVECDTLYEDPTIVRRPYRFCTDGSWDYSWPKCEPVCGIKSVEGRKLLINGTDVIKGDYPWQVGVYLADTLEHKCGGSVISPRLSLSAAHCFELEDPAKYKLAAGKYYRNFNDPRDIGAQYTKISHLIIHSDYNNGEPYVAYDLAILIHETPFIMNKFVLPVCFASKFNFDYSTLIGKTGIVTGWGYTESNSSPSETLKQLEVKYYSKATCQLPTDFRLYYLPYAPDKLCAGLLHEGKSACQGDSGGPLVFLGENERYFIRGIVSVAPQKTGGCDATQLALYTAVPYHNDLIQKIESQYPS